MDSVLQDGLAVRITGVLGWMYSADPARQPRTLTSENAGRFRARGDATFDAFCCAVAKGVIDDVSKHGRTHATALGDLSECQAARALLSHLCRGDVQVLREVPSRPAVMKDVEEDVLGQMALRQESHRPFAQERRALLVGEAPPRGDEVVGEHPDFEAATGRQFGEGAMIVVEVRLELASTKTQRPLEHLLVERDPVVSDPILFGEPRVRSARWGKGVVRVDGLRPPHGDAQRGDERRDEAEGRAHSSPPGGFG